jgi:hypothetical protein
MADEPTPSPAPSRTRGCLTFLGVWIGVSVVLYPFILFSHVAETYGGLKGLLATIATTVSQSVSNPGRGSELGYIALAVLVVAYCIAALGVFLGLVLGSVWSIFAAAFESLAIVVVGYSLIDAFRLRGSVGRDDPRYGRKWGGRGAVVGVAIWLWVCVLVPPLSRLGAHPTEFPTAGQSIFLFVLLGITMMVLARLASFFWRHVRGLF